MNGMTYATIDRPEGPTLSQIEATMAQIKNHDPLVRLEVPPHIYDFIRSYMYAKDRATNDFAGVPIHVVDGLTQPWAVHKSGARKPC